MPSPSLSHSLSLSLRWLFLVAQSMALTLDPVPAAKSSSAPDVSAKTAVTAEIEAKMRAQMAQLQAATSQASPRRSRPRRSRPRRSSRRSKRRAPLLGSPPEEELSAPSDSAPTSPKRPSRVCSIPLLDATRSFAA